MSPVSITLLATVTVGSLSDTRTRAQQIPAPKTPADVVQLMEAAKD